MKSIHYIFGLILLLAIIGAAGIYINGKKESGEVLACTMEAQICPDGSAVGRTGPNCSFAPCPTGEAQVPDDVNDMIESKADLIVVSSPKPNTTVSSPLTITGKARGTWFFEASFPITIVDWDGLIIGEGIATADGEWMTTEFVPFTATISYDLPLNAPYTRGTLILMKDNPSGLPENDDALEIPVNLR